ncbi:hypothetical protein AVEN_240410-1 [Araneus ventricosus]|uniref:Mutator-like transposase domain-containing protein n=1 Tax=Araneus ventricosus TaxID=182803 RepID=A0A4Y2H4H8_ARAVE|nr:hypothetical protein AVEN_240410-1 [Araneus ventricosus]
MERYTCSPETTAIKKQHKDDLRKLWSPKGRVWTILNESGAHPYRSTPEQGLLTKDTERRYTWCKFVMNNLEDHRTLLVDIIMNLPFMSKSTFRRHEDQLLKAVRCAADKNMKEAAAEVRTKTKTSSCGVSVDGTWQRRGHNSLNGCVSAI